MLVKSGETKKLHGARKIHKVYTISFFLIKTIGKQAIFQIRGNSFLSCYNILNLEFEEVVFWDEFRLKYFAITLAEFFSVSG